MFLQNFYLKPRIDEAAGSLQIGNGLSESISAVVKSDGRWAMGESLVALGRLF